MPPPPCYLMADSFIGDDIWYIYDEAPNIKSTVNRLYGDGDLTDLTNSRLFKAVHEYLKSTARFD